MQDTDREDQSLVVAICVLVVVLIVVIAMLFLVVRPLSFVSVKRVTVLEPTNTPFTLPRFNSDSLAGRSTGNYYYYVANGYNNTGKAGNMTTCGEGLWGPSCTNLVYPETYVHDVSGIDGPVIDTQSVDSLTSCTQLCNSTEQCEAVSYDQGVCRLHSNVRFTQNQPDSYSPLTTGGVYVKSDVVPQSEYAYAYGNGVVRYWLERGDVLRIEMGRKYMLPATYNTVSNGTRYKLVVENARGHRLMVVGQTIELPSGYDIAYLEC